MGVLNVDLTLNLILKSNPTVSYYAQYYDHWNSSQ